MTKIQNAKSELHGLLEKQGVAGIPLLVLGNKNDLNGALGVEVLTEQLYEYLLV